MKRHNQFVTHSSTRKGTQILNPRKISRILNKEKNLENFRFFSLYCENCESEANSLRFASQKIEERSLRFRFAF